MGKILYHVSRETEVIEEFIPRIPESRAGWEDETNQRVCLSSSIEGCLTGVPWGSVGLEDIFLGSLGLSQLLRVYEFDMSLMNKEDVIFPEELYKDGCVTDAMVTDEHWFIGNFIKPTKTYLIELKDYLEQSVDVYSYEDEKYIMENEDSITNEEIMERLQYSMSQIYEAIYSVVDEDKRSGIVERAFRIRDNVSIDEILDSDVLYNLEEVFGYTLGNYAEVEDGLLKIKIDTRLREMNISRFKDLLKDVCPNIII